MQTQKTIYFLSLFFGLPNQALGFFDPNSLVKDVNGIDFEKKIHKSKHVTMVKFYAPWCGHCKNLAPIYHDVASKIKGLAKVVAINCDEQMNKVVCSKYGIQGFPTLKLFPSSVVSKASKKQPIDYNGERSKKAIKDFILNAIPDTSKKIVSKEKATKYSLSIDAFLENDSSSLPKVLLFSEKPMAQPLYKSLALEFHERANFGLVNKKEAELVKKYDIQKFPSLLVVPTQPETNDEPLNHVNYEGDFGFDKLKEFLDKYAVPKKSKKTNANDTVNSGDDKDDTKEEKKEEPFDPEVSKLTEQDEFEKECLDKAGICVLNLIPAGEDALMNSLKEIKKKIYDTKKTVEMFSSVPDVNFYYANILPTTFLMKQFEIGNVRGPVTLILQPRRKLYAFKDFSGESDLQSSLYQFLESGVKGKVKFYQYSFVPKIKKVKKSKVAKESDYDEL